MNFKIEMLLNSLFATNNYSIGVFDLFLALVLPFLLSFCTTKLYMHTQKTNNYNQSFIHALFIFSILTSIITMIIGSNLARAFGLVGALSIIRFRNALKSPLDTIYFFWSLSIGMACGTGFFMAAIMLTVITAIFILILHKFNYGNNEKLQSLLKISTNHKDIAEKLISDFSSDYKLENILFNSNVKNKEYVYSLRLNKDADLNEFYEKLNKEELIVKFEHMNNEIINFME